MSYYRTLQSDSFVSSRRSRQWQRNQNTVAYAPRAALGPITHTVLVALMIAVLGLIYLSQVTKTSSFGYVLQNQTDELSSLAAEQQDLEVENARLQALTRVKESNVAKAMTAPISVDHVTN